GETSYSNVQTLADFVKFADGNNPDAFTTTAPGRTLFPGYGVQTYAGLAGTGYDPTDNFSHQFGANLHRQLGRHSLKAGITLLHFDYYVNNISQTLAFTPQPTQNLASPAGTGQAMASFLLGLPSNGTRPLGTPDFDGYGWMYGVYLADTYRVNSKLSLSFGLRWDKSGNFLSRSGVLGSFDRSTKGWL